MEDLVLCLRQMITTKTERERESELAKDKEILGTDTVLRALRCGICE